MIVCYCRFLRLTIPDMELGGPQHNLNLVSLWLINVFDFLNSSFNFFIYYTMGSRFRATLWGLLGRTAKKATSREMSGTSGTYVTQS